MALVSDFYSLLNIKGNIMYRILFVDEVVDDMRRFQRYVNKEDSNKEFEVIVKMPVENIEELIEDIFSEQIDAVISDFQLAEYADNITYTGVQLINKILQRKNKFPCFVMTSHDDKAVATSSDVNLIYIKALLAKEDKVKVTFLERVKRQIENYRAELENAQNGINKIVKLSKERDLTAPEEVQLIKFDKFLEQSLDQTSQIPSKLKDRSTLDDLHKLIENTDVLLAKIDDCSNG